MKKYRVFQCKDLTQCNQIVPDFIYNRYDCWKLSHDEFSLWCCEVDSEKVFFEVLVKEQKAKLGIWLMSIDEVMLKQIIKVIFKTYRDIKSISFENGYSSAFGKVTQRNHFRIKLPYRIEDLDKRLSKKGRYNIRREKRILNDFFGVYEIRNVPALSDEASKIWSKYFKYKELTHHMDYHMGIQEYCSRYHVTDVYALFVGENKHIASIILSCEQCSITYIENLTYDIEMSEFSPGQILYDEYLKTLIMKGFREIYLLGGDYSYKKRYGSVEEVVFNCEIPRNIIARTHKWGMGVIRKEYHKLKGITLGQ